MSELSPIIAVRLPGLALSAAVGLAALAAERAEIRATGARLVDGLVIAIALGVAVRGLFGLAPRFVPGVRFAAREVLEAAVMLLGAGIGLDALARGGPAMAALVGVTVPAALLAGYGIGRLLGLPPRLATLVACGNAICGNSAIVAAAPVIAAEEREVAAAVAFTAALGIVVVLLLPLVFAVAPMGAAHYGALAGMTVYAVPQVLAAAAPAGALAIEVGTLVKLMRVLMLGPVLLALGLAGRRGGRGPQLGRMVPWFVTGFFALMAARTAGLLPEPAVALAGGASSAATLVAMAALGLSVDFRAVLASGGRVLLAGVLSLAALAAASLVVMTLLGL